MADSTNGVRAWAGDEPLTAAHIFIAPVGTTLPTDATSDLDAAFEDGGRLDDGGLVVSESYATTEADDFSGTSLRTLCNKATAALSGNLVQWTEETLKATYGKESVTNAGGALHVRAGRHLPARVSVVVNAKDGNDALRLVFPNVQRVPGSFSIAPGVVSKLPVNMTAHCGTDGEFMHKYSAGADVE